MILISRAQLQTHQKLLFKALIGLLFLGGGLLLVLGRESTPAEPAPAEPALVDLSRSLEDKNFWLFKAEHQLQEQQRTQEIFKAELEKLARDQAQQFHQFQEHQRLLEQAESLHRAEGPEPATFNENSHESASKETPDNTLGSSSGIFSETLALTQTKSTLRHIDHFIPAGTYVKAVLLNGLDISAGVSSQANPQPVLLRLVDLGSMPNHSKSKLKDCRVIAAAHGELSNERVNMRLETLSCVQDDGRVIEIPVSGFVNGLDGKNGIRGKVVLRDAEVLKRGFMGGLLSGLSKASLSKNTPLMGSLPGNGSMDLFRQAGSEGASDAFELMAKYNIQRAEQYQPVLQISAGVEVDVVFHSGTAFGDQQAKSLPSVPNTPFNEGGP